MDIVLVLLRLIHIVAAFIWFGAGAATLFYIAPAVSAAGESGLRYMKALLTRTPYPKTFPIAAGVTMLAGILLYLIGNSASHFSTTGNIVLGIGAVAGILAGIHGGAKTGRTTRELGEALVQYVPEGSGSIPADGMAVLRERAQKLASDSRVSFILMVIALLGMATARYL
jgi:hypothetical protein